MIASEVSRFSRSMGDFAPTVERIVDENAVALHIFDMGIGLDPNDRDPYTRAFQSVAAIFVKLEAEISQYIARSSTY